MAQGTSGRIVIEIDPFLKRRLRAALDLDGRTLKAWFIQKVETYVENHEELKKVDQGPLFASRQGDDD